MDRKVIFKSSSVFVRCAVPASSTVVLYEIRLRTSGWYSLRVEKSVSLRHWYLSLCMGGVE